jgi:pyrophosphatase PpaX
MKQYKAYLFDADGTLFDTTELIYQCFLYSCKKYGDIDVSREAVFSNIGIPLRPQLEHFLGKMSDYKEEEIVKAHMDYQLKIYQEHLRLFPGVKKTLVHLKDTGKKMAVVTSRKQYTLTLYLKQTAIYHYFDALITPELTKKHKPEPEPALEALKQLNCAPSETLFVGDAIFDIECGERAGMDTAFVTWSQIDAESLSIKPTYVIDSMNELY